MIKVEDLFEAIRQTMDTAEGHLISMDVETDEENIPIKIIIRSDVQTLEKTYFVETVITENGFKKSSYE